MWFGERFSLKFGDVKGFLSLRNLRWNLSALVLCKNIDAALVALSSGPLLVKEGVDNSERLFLRVHTAANADELCIVVLASQAGGLWGPRQSATSALYLVRCNLLTVARAAKDNAEGAWVVDSTQSCLDTKCWVVILSVINVCATIDNVVALLLQVFGDDILRLETCMVCS